MSEKERHEFGVRAELAALKEQLGEMEANLQLEPTDANGQSTAVATKQPESGNTEAEELQRLRGYLARLGAGERERFLEEARRLAE